MRRVYLLILVGIFLKLPGFAQTNRYVVFFTDKQNNTYSIEQPEEFLSERAIQRRTRQNIAITGKDLPPTQAYLNELADKGAKILYTSRWMNAALVEADESMIPTIESLAAVARLEYVALGDSRARRSGYSFSFRNSRRQELSTRLQNEMIGIDNMHSAGLKGENMWIAIFDGGFQGADTIRYFRHLYDNNKVMATRDFVGHGADVYRYDDHGTNVFSCLGGYDPQLYSGTAPQASYVLCVTEAVNSEFRVEEYNWLFAAEYADSLGVDIINSSLGYSTFDDRGMDYTYDDLDGDKAVITRAADYAASVGMLVVTSAGNERNNNWKYIVAPADADTILAVGAVNSIFNPTNFTSAGPTVDGRVKPEVAALGEGVRLVNNAGTVTSNNGTSFASPLIAGLAAGVWQAKPELTNMEVIQLLKSSASQSMDPDSLIVFF
ncbi:MAG: S8 family peptidase [Cyclobacteriaceae bacterium]